MPGGFCAARGLRAAGRPHSGPLICSRLPKDRGGGREARVPGGRDLRVRGVYVGGQKWSIKFLAICSVCVCGGGGWLAGADKDLDEAARWDPRPRRRLPLLAFSSFLFFRSPLCVLSAKARAFLLYPPPARPPCRPLFGPVLVVEWPDRRRAGAGPGGGRQARRGGGQAEPGAAQGVQGQGAAPPPVSGPGERGPGRLVGFECGPNRRRGRGSGPGAAFFWAPAEFG